MVPVDILHVPFAFMPEHEAAPLVPEPEAMPGHDPAAPVAPDALHCAFVIGHVPVEPPAAPPIMCELLRPIIPAPPCAAASKTKPMTARLATAIPTTTLFRVLTIHTPSGDAPSENRLPAPREPLVSTACRHFGDQTTRQPRWDALHSPASSASPLPRSRTRHPCLSSSLLCGSLVSALVFSVCISHFLAHPARVRYSPAG
jgi:hypothetical protein